MIFVPYDMVFSIIYDMPLIDKYGRNVIIFYILAILFHTTYQ